MNYTINFTSQIIKFITETRSIESRLNKIIECKDGSELVFTFMDKDNEVFKLTLTSQIKNEKVHIVFEYRGKGVSTSNDYECAMVLYDSEKSDACIERGLNILMNRKPLIKGRDFDSVLVQGYENFICVEKEHMLIDYVVKKDDGKENRDAKTQHNPVLSFKNKYFNSHIDRIDEGYGEKITPTKIYQNTIAKRLLQRSDLNNDELELSVWFDYLVLATSESKTLTTNTLYQLIDKIYTTIATYCKYTAIEASIDFTDSYNNYMHTPYCIRANWISHRGINQTTYMLITPQNINKTNVGDSYIAIDMYIKNRDDNNIQRMVSYKISMDDLCSIENLEKLCTAPSFLEKYLETDNHKGIMCFINNHTKGVLDEDYRCESIVSRRFMFNIVFIAARLITMNMLSNTANDIECCTNIPIDILDKYYEDNNRYTTVYSVYDMLSEFIEPDSDQFHMMFPEDHMITLYINELNYKYLCGFINNNNLDNNILHYNKTRTAIAYRCPELDNNLKGIDNVVDMPLFLAEMGTQKFVGNVIEMDVISAKAIEILTSLISSYDDIKIPDEDKIYYCKPVLRYNSSEAHSVVLAFGIKINKEARVGMPKFEIGCIISLYTNGYTPLIFNTFCHKAMDDYDAVNFIVKMIGQYIVVGAVPSLDATDDKIDMGLLQRSYAINYELPSCKHDKIKELITHSNKKFKDIISRNAHKYLGLAAELSNSKKHK